MTITIQKEEDGRYFVQINEMSGVRAEWDTLDEALDELKNVYDMIQEERDSYNQIPITVNTNFFTNLITPDYKKHLIGLNFRSLQLAV